MLKSLSYFQANSRLFLMVWSLVISPLSLKVAPDCLPEPRWGHSQRGLLTPLPPNLLLLQEGMLCCLVAREGWDTLAKSLALGLQIIVPTTL